jgi:hypothetical protein
VASIVAPLAWLVAAIAAALIASLFVPVDYVIAAGTREGVRMRARWLFGLVRVAYDSSARAGAAVDPSRAPPASVRGLRLVRRLLAIDGLVTRAAMFVVEIVRSLGWQCGRIAVRVGLEDPADTGELCGMVAPMLVMASRLHGPGIEFEPDFETSRFDARAEGSGRFVPARAVVAIGRFALSRPGRGAIGVMLWKRAR